MSSDILDDIPDEDLPKLAEIYKSHQNWAPVTYYLILTGIKWKQNEKNRKFLTFMSPQNCWKTDGTFVLKMEGYRYDVFVFTLQESCENLYNGLMKTNRIDITKKLIFFAIHEKHLDVINRFIKEKKLKIQFNLSSVFKSMSVEKAKELTIDCPPEVYIMKLQIENTEQINNIWPHRAEGSDKYIGLLIEMNGGFGVFLKSTNKMISWNIGRGLGYIGVLQTEEGFKKRGYGSLITKFVCKKIAEEGLAPVATTLNVNTASREMFKKLGFDEIGSCSFIGVQHDSNINMNHTVI